MTLVRQAFVLVLAGLLAVGIIFAADKYRSDKDAMLASLGMAGKKEATGCPPGMIEARTSEGTLCVDRYEAAPGKTCPHQDPTNEQETLENISWPDCSPSSESGRMPWRNVALHEAATLCARAGKRLPTAQEWYRAALGTPDGLVGASPACNTGAIGRTGPEETGKFSQCLSSIGANDMIGNVWEWVDEMASDGVFHDRTLPDSGYVTSVDTAGVPATVSEEADPSFYNDYFWVEKTGVRGMFRGGFWGIGDRVGLYAVNATVETSFSGNGVGFRCVK